MGDDTNPKAKANLEDLKQRISEAIDACTLRQELFTLLFVKIPGIDQINAGLGYEFGEEAQEIALNKISELMIEGDCVAALAPGKLIVLSRDCNSPSCAVKGSSAILGCLKSTVRIDGIDCMLNPAIGIAVFPNDGRSASDLIRNASLAAEEASTSDISDCVFFARELGENARNEFALQQEIRKAISQKQFELFYQPKIDAQSFTAVGCEALIRWRHPDGGCRAPGSFLEVAERGGLLLPMGHLVLTQACNQIRTWIDAGHADASASINAASQQFAVPNWCEVVDRSIRKTGIPASALTIELTETETVSDMTVVMEQMKAIRALGVRISLDDFGTGHSSLARLSSLPADEVKIDRMFVQSAQSCPSNAEICRSIIRLSHEFSMDVVAEGIETEEQALMMRNLGCDLLQGFLFSEPLPIADYGPWLKCTGGSAKAEPATARRPKGAVA